MYMLQLQIDSIHFDFYLGMYIMDNDCKLILVPDEKMEFVMKLPG